MTGRMSVEQQIEREARWIAQMQNADDECEALVTRTQALRVPRCVLQGWFAGREPEQEMMS